MCNSTALKFQFLALSDSNGCFLCLNENVDWLDYQSSAISLLFFFLFSKLTQDLYSRQPLFEKMVYYIAVPLDTFPVNCHCLKLSPKHQDKSTFYSHLIGLI